MKHILKIVFPVLLIGLANVAFARRCDPNALAPMPGFFQMMLGDFKVVALNDGVVSYRPQRHVESGSR